MAMSHKWEEKILKKQENISKNKKFFIYIYSKKYFLVLRAKKPHI